MNNAERITLIQQRLETTLKPTHLKVTDESDQHIGHAGAATGMGHFAVAITSHAFKGKSLQQRHRMVYQSLGDLLKTEIHALRINCQLPE